MENNVFYYNSIPIYVVGFSDFMLFSSYLNKKEGRLLSKKIKCDDLRDKFTKSKNYNYGIYYDGIIVDLRSLNS
jgi:hypothetical protein